MRRKTINVVERYVRKCRSMTVAGDVQAPMCRLKEHNRTRGFLDT